MLYSYNANNLMDAATVSGTTTTYAYDADDWRVKKAVTGGKTSYYFRGPNGQLLTEWWGTAQSPSTRDYVYAGSRLIAVAGAGEASENPPPDDDTPKPPSFTLRSGEILKVSHFLQSRDGRFSLWYQDDGNLVLYHQATASWASNTAGTTHGSAAMQGDGNFIVYNGAGTPLCASGTDGNFGAYLVLRNDGVVVIYDATGAPLRSSPGLGSICQPIVP